MPTLSLSQAGQDTFPRHLIDRRGTYLDIGSYRPTYHNNTYSLEMEGWTGLSMDYNNYVEEFDKKRKNQFIHADATNVDWNSVIERYPFLQKPVDYISFDVDESTKAAVEHFPFNKIKFATMTIEHDAYRFGTETRSFIREKLIRLGYDLVCADVVMPDAPHEKYGAFEDWWVMPALVNMDKANQIRCANLTYLEIFKKMNPNPYAFYCPPPSYE